MKGFALLSLVLILTASLTAIFNIVSGTEIPGIDPPNILIINSYHSEYEWTRDQVEGFVAEVRVQYPDAQFYTEFLDAKRINRTTYQHSYARMLSAKYIGMRFSLVYATDDIALDFVQTFSERVWDHNTPIIASGINFYQALDPVQHPLTRGIFEKEAGSAVILTALQQNPNAKLVVIIADQTEVGTEIGDQVEAQTRNLCNLPIIRCTPMNWDDLLNFIGKFDSNTIFLLAQYTVDPSGRYINPIHVSASIAEHANGPVYVFTEMYDKCPNIVGGQVNCGSDHGHLAGKLARMILAGRPVQMLPSDEVCPQRWIFNYKAMQRFGIPESTLPPDSTVIGKPVNFILDHLALTLTVLLGVAAQSLLILFLLISIRRRRAVTGQLQKNEAQLRMMIEQSPLAIFISDHTGNIVLINSKFRVLMGYSIQELSTLEHMRELIIPDLDGRIKLQEKMEESESVAALTGTTPDPVEYKARTKNGSEVEVEMYFADAGGLSFRIMHDVTQRNHVMREIRQSTLAAQAANEAKSRFLANVSHEIRTPMNGILGMVQLLRETAVTTDQGDCIDTIKDSCDLLVTVINDILDLSKIEAGQVTLEREPTDLRAFLSSIANIVGTTIEAKGLEFVCNVSSALPEVISCDHNRLKQILLNLLVNASKFTDAGLVELHVQGSGQPGETGNIHFDIIDTGIGIPPDQLARIFEPFIQVDTSNTRRRGGTGLGLSICRRLIQLMGGEISLTSEIGKGSTFSFYIVVPVLSQTDLKSKPDEKIDTHLSLDCPMSILMAEDNLVNKKVASMMLKKMGYIADVASNGVEALDKASRKHYDVILMDVQMPFMDGLTATQKIREYLSPEAQPQIIALTAHAMSEDIKHCLDAGMNGHLTKPLRASQLRKALTDAYNQIHCTTSGAEKAQGN
jgi:PAS domain S-box-containing protein